MFANNQYFPFIRKEANAEIVAAVDIVLERAIKACNEYHIPAYMPPKTKYLTQCHKESAWLTEK